MAFPSPLLFITLLSMISIRSSSAQNPFVNVTLAGVVTCENTSLATAKTFPVIPQAKVDVVSGIWPFERVMKSTTTNIAGIYYITFTPTEILSSNPQLCRLRVTMPPDSCTFNPPGGTLSFPIIGVGSILGFGPVSSYIAGVPSYVLGFPN